MRHQQATVLDIVKQATRELDIDQLEVENGIFDNTNATQLRWQSLLISATEWLLTLQINLTVFAPLKEYVAIDVTYSSYEKEIKNRTVINFNPLLPNVLPVKESRSYIGQHGNTHYRTYLQFKKNAFVLPFDFLDILELKQCNTYKIIGNELYIYGNNLKTIHLTYISNSCYLVNNQRSRSPVSNEDICLLDKELVVKALKYMYCKEVGDQTMQLKEIEVNNRANYFLGKDTDYKMGNGRINLGRRW
ncbi:hypothetical protein ACFX5K_01340 [Rickettsiales bacterium LUAb2]